MALDRSVNRESNAFMGSILEGVVNTERDNAAGVEVAFTLGREKKDGRACQAQSITDLVVQDLHFLEPRGRCTNIKLV